MLPQPVSDVAALGRDALALFDQRAAVVAGAGDEAVDSWIGSLVFFASIAAIGVIAAGLVWKARRNRRW